jgi:hypothetical protein
MMGSYLWFSCQFLSQKINGEVVLIVAPLWRNPMVLDMRDASAGIATQRVIYLAILTEALCALYGLNIAGETFA